MHHALWWIFLSLTTTFFSEGPMVPTPESVGATLRSSSATSSTTNEASAAFSLAYKGEITSARVNLVTALPGDSVAFDVLGSAPSGNFTLTAERGTVTPSGTGGWWWHAPSTPGLSRIVARAGGIADSVIFNAFVMVRSEHVQNGALNGYHIGEYPARPLRGLDIYLPPPGYIEVTPENENTLISPHFRLREFVTKQAGGYPKYVVLTERLIHKLEYLLNQLSARGMAASFFVMSGYRTPSYNRAIGNVQYSRHVYGAAADIFVDENPRDGVMDDLNGDNKIDVQDAQVLVDIVNEQIGKEEYLNYIGGLGRYKANAHHGPFVHIDVRDRPARW